MGTGAVAMADGSVVDVRTPNSDGPGDTSWQRAQALLANVMAQEKARTN